MQAGELEYVGFWARVLASLVDSVLILVLAVPLLQAVYGPGYWMDSSLVAGPVDFLVNWVLPAVAVVAFWVARQATPGKMLLSARVVDAATGDKPGVGQCIGRYLGYYVSTLPLLLGFIWVGIDTRKQGWHDKLAGTVVVRPRPRGVTFEGRWTGRAGAIGLAYAWLSVQRRIDRPLVGLSMYGKLAAAGLVIVLGVTGDLPARSIAAVVPDIIFAAIFARRLLDTSEARLRGRGAPGR